MAKKAVENREVETFGMCLNIQIIRHRPSVTQGEIEVRFNGKTVVRYGDKISAAGPYYRMFGGWGSEFDDKEILKAAMEQYPKEILSTLPNLQTDTAR